MREPTMADIAARLGVSRQLVSIAMRGLPGASSETRERVQKVAEELGYRPHLAARSLRQTKSRHIDPGRRTPDRPAGPPAVGIRVRALARRPGQHQPPVRRLIRPRPGASTAGITPCLWIAAIHDCGPADRAIPERNARRKSPTHR